MSSISSSEEFPSYYLPSSDEGGIDSLSSVSSNGGASLSGNEAVKITPRYVSKNGKEIWNSQLFVNRERLSAENVLKQKEGVTAYAIHRLNTIESSLDLFLTSEIVQTIVEMTNKEGSSVLADGWKSITPQEFRRFLGVLYLIGLFESFNATLHRAYNLSECMTVDEQLATFRGRCPFRQYIPSKPGKYGIKSWLLCDSDTSYVLNMQVYTGRDPQQPRETSQMVEALQPTIFSQAYHWQEHFWLKRSLWSELSVTIEEKFPYVLSAVWLLMVFFGNFIDMIIMATNIYNNAVFGFFFSAGLMVFAAGIFIVLTMKYTYVEHRLPPISVQDSKIIAKD